MDAAFFRRERLGRCDECRDDPALSAAARADRTCVGSCGELDEMLLARRASGDGERAEQLLDQARATSRELGMKTYAAEASHAVSAR